MSYKRQVLQEIMAELANLNDQDAIDSLRVEVVNQGKRKVIVSDSTMLAVHELGFIVPAYLKPKLRLV